MRDVPLGFFIFPSDEGSPARLIYLFIFIVSSGISSSFFLLQLAITVALPQSPPA
jgi:hypothetical protein